MVGCSPSLSTSLDIICQCVSPQNTSLNREGYLPENIKFSPTTPFAFTEQGVAMLSSVLNSDKAIDVNISIMRAFVALREHLTDYSNLKEHIAQLEKEMNIKFKDIHQALNYLLQKDKVQFNQQNRERIGFKNDRKDY